MSESTKPTMKDAIESLTGFEEIAVERHFGSDLGSLTATMMMRAVVFVLLTRESGDPATSYGDVMKMSLKDVQTHFSDEESGNE